MVKFSNVKENQGQLLCLKMSATGHYPEHISLGSILVLSTLSSLRWTLPFHVIWKMLCFSHVFHAHCIFYATYPLFVNLNNIIWRVQITYLSSMLLALYFR
jgi:hypothetical protein